MKPHDYAGGYVALFRSLLDSPHFQDSEYLHVWIFILLSASFKRKLMQWNGVTVELHPGEFVSSRREIAQATGVQESKVGRIIDTMKSEDQIAIQQGSKKAVFTVVNWARYQKGEDQIADQLKTN